MRGTCILGGADVDDYDEYGYLKLVGETNENAMYEKGGREGDTMEWKNRCQTDRQARTWKRKAFVMMEL